MDRRIITKFTTQNKGSVTHQFLLMVWMLIIARLMGEPVALLLRLTGKLSVPSSSVQLMTYAKWGNVGLLLLGVITVYLLWKRDEKHAPIH